MASTLSILTFVPPGRVALVRHLEATATAAPSASVPEEQREQSIQNVSSCQESASGGLS